MSYQELPLTPELHAYLQQHSTQPDDLTNELIAETRANLPANASMQIAPEQATFLRILTSVLGVRQAVEVGTSTGLSSLSIARGLADGGRLTCFDISEEFTGVARRYWKAAGVEDRIELRIGAAVERLRELPAEPHLDLVFIDADKESYGQYWDELVPRVRPGGVLLVDNTLRGGRVLAPEYGSDRAMVAFNTKALNDPRTELVLLPVADGLTFARRLPDDKSLS